MPHQVILSERARAALVRGMMKVADAVSVTLGPKGRTVVLDKPGLPIVTKDGVTVARGIDLADPVERIGAKLIKSVANKVVDEAGDGTTSSVLLAATIVREGQKVVAAGGDPSAIRRGIEKGAKQAVDAIRALATPVKDDDLAKIASISANDPMLGKTVADALHQVGEEGILVIEEANKVGIEPEIVQGMRFDRGYISPYFVTDENKMECRLDEPAIFVANAKFNMQKELMPLLEKVYNAKKKSLLIVADDVAGQALGLLVINAAKSGLKICAVRSPSLGEKRKDVLDDISILTGATTLSDETGAPPQSATLEHLGSAKTVIVTRDHTTIAGGGGLSEAVEERITSLRNLLAGAKSEYEKETFSRRLARLTGSFGYLWVGASTEVETREIKHRLEDAVLATRAASTEGIVPGGGKAYLLAAKALTDDTCTREEAAGLHILKRALEEPVRRIAENAGADGGAIVSESRSLADEGGYDAATGRFTSLLDAGIIDPAKVARVVIENACSVAGLVLGTDALIADDPEPPKKRKKVRPEDVDLTGEDDD